MGAEHGWFGDFFGFDDLVSAGLEGVNDTFGHHFRDLAGLGLLLLMLTRKSSRIHQREDTEFGMRELPQILSEEWGGVWARQGGCSF